MGKKFKMIACVVFVLGQLVIGLSANYDSQYHDDFEARVTEAVRKVINVERVEQLERDVASLHRISEAQEARISHLESEKNKQGKIIQQLIRELSTFKKGFHSATNKTKLIVPKDHENETRYSQQGDKHTYKASMSNRNNTRAKQSRIRRGYDETVAFSVYLGQSMETLSPGNIVRCNNVILNSGHAYNIQTGVFTAPYDGIYLFDYHFDSTKHTVLALYVDGANQLDAVSYPGSSREGMGGNLIIVDLKAGQQVWLEGRIIADGMVIGDDSFRYTTFSGMMIY